MVQGLKFPSQNPNPWGEEEGRGRTRRWRRGEPGKVKKKRERVGRERDIYPPLTLD